MKEETTVKSMSKYLFWKMGGVTETCEGEDNEHWQRRLMNTVQ